MMRQRNINCILLCALLAANVKCGNAWRRSRKHIHFLDKKIILAPSSIETLQELRGGSFEAETPLDATVQDPVSFENTQIAEKSRNGGDNHNYDWRKDLPEQLQQRKGALHRFMMPTGVPLKNSGSNLDENLCEVYVLGTAHVSKDSCDDVKLLMEHVRPDVLFVELCSQRMTILEDEVVPIEQEIHQSTDDEKSLSVGQMTNQIMAQNPGMNKAAAMSSVLLSKIQGDYATKLNVTIGGEFREAYQCANAQQKEFVQLLDRLKWENAQGSINQDTLQKARASNGCSVVLGDRPVRLTLLRAWEALSFFGKIKLVVALAWSSLRQPSVEELKEWIDSIMNDPSNDILSKSVEELGRHFPAIKKTIIEERDVYMSCKIVQTARIMGMGSSQDGQVRKIVAVVGAGHCPGISSILDGEVEQYGSLDAEGELMKVIETKKHKVKDDDNMKSLITNVESVDVITQL